MNFKKFGEFGLNNKKKLFERFLHFFLLQCVKIFYLLFYFVWAYLLQSTFNNKMHVAHSNDNNQQ